MVELLSKFIEFISKLFAPLLNLQASQFERRKRIVDDARFGISSYMRHRHNPEFHFEQWYLALRGHIHPKSRRFLELSRDKLEKAFEEDGYIAYEDRLRFLIDEVTRLSQKWKLD